MRIILESTGQIVEVGGVLCRVWQGATLGGAPVTALIARVGTHTEAGISELGAELIETPDFSGRGGKSN